MTVNTFKKIFYGCIGCGMIAGLLFLLSLFMFNSVKAVEVFGIAIIVCQFILGFLLIFIGIKPPKE